MFASLISVNRRRALLWGLALVVAVAAIYGTTIQRDINGSSNKFAEDVGEFQNVLAQWGTAHPTGYPLYSFTGAVFTSVLRVVGVEPAAAASVYSAFLGLIALLGVYALLMNWNVRPPLAAGATLWLSVLFPFWLYASVAGTRTLLVLLIVTPFLIVARWWVDRKPRHLIELAVVIGLGIGHHRLTMLVLPALAIYAGPLALAAARERPVRVLAALGAFLASFLIYLYLPIRAWMGGTWIYGQPGSWDGFWAIVTQREYGSLVRLPSNLAAIGSGFSEVVDTLMTYLTWPIILAGSLGLVLALANKSRRKIGLALTTLVIANVAFASVFPRAVLLLSAMIPAMWGLVMGVGCLAQIVTGNSRWRSMAVMIGIAAGIVALLVRNGPTIQAMTQDTAGRAIIQNVAKAQINVTTDRPTVMALWGRDFFALAYARWVTDELAGIDVVDHRANVRALVADGRSLYVLSPTFYLRPISWWNEQLGHAYLSSFAGNLVQVSDRAILTEADVSAQKSLAPMSPSIGLRNWQVTPLTDGQWQITLYWQAVAKPDRDYSVFVQASDRDTIDSPEAIVAQADSSAPVQGWYPTTLWSAGEIVRDDHLIAPPTDRPAKIVVVGLYIQDEVGRFINFGQQMIP
ncbi:MAG TPA: DUF2723 domain-containing protein, partial [Anaerolineae bacterium]|nr:DUF2723 domain-containing protein [Anaerolineae bacterium]